MALSGSPCWSAFVRLEWVLRPDVCGSFWLLFVFIFFSFVLVCVFGLLEQFESCGVSLFTDPEVEMVSMVGALARVSRCVRNWYP